MSVHSRILPVILAHAEAATGCRTYGRRRMIKDEATLTAECGTTDMITTDGESYEIDVIKALFVTRTEDPVTDRQEEPDGNEYAAVRGPSYEFEIWLSYSDESDSETRVQAIYDALAAHFETAAFRTALRAVDAVLVEPVEMQESTISVVHTGHTMSRIVARAGFQGGTP